MEPDHEKRFALLMSEKEHADAQIRSYMDLQSKSTGIVFVALTAAAGWIFAGRPAPLTTHDRGVALIILVLIAAFSIIYGAFTYCAALGYMWYKDEKLNPLLQAVTGAPAPRAVTAFAESPANRVVRRLAGAFNVLLIVGCMAIVAVVLTMSGKVPALRWWAAAAFLMLVLAVVAIWDTRRAIVQTFERVAAGEREAGSVDDALGG